MRSYLIYETALQTGLGKIQKIVPQEKWDHLDLTKLNDLHTFQMALRAGIASIPSQKDGTPITIYQNKNLGNVTYKPGEGILVVYAPAEAQESIQKQILLWTSPPNLQPQILIDVKFVAGTPAAAGKIYQEMLNPQTPGTCQIDVGGGWPVGLEEKWLTNSADYFRANNRTIATFSPVAVLSSARFAAVLDALKQQEGCEIVSTPKITTLSGRQARLSVEQGRELFEPSGAATKMPFGPAIDITQTVEFRGAQSIIDLSATFTLMEFMGYSDDATLKDFNPIGNRPKPLPVIRMRQSESKARLYPQQTVVLGGRARIPSAQYSPAKEDKSFVLVFLTITLIHPNGESYTKESIDKFPG